jgi:hypothetical protein
LVLFATSLVVVGCGDDADANTGGGTGTGDSGSDGATVTGSDDGEDGTGETTGGGDGFDPTIPIECDADELRAEGEFTGDLQFSKGDTDYFDAMVGGRYAYAVCFRLGEETPDEDIVNYEILGPRLSVTPLAGAATPPVDYVPTVLGVGTTQQVFSLRLLTLGEEARVELSLQSADASNSVFSFVVAMANTGLELHPDGYPVLASFETDEFYPSLIRQTPGSTDAVDAGDAGSHGSFAVP